MEYRNYNLIQENYYCSKVVYLIGLLLLILPAHKFRLLIRMLHAGIIVAGTFYIYLLGAKLRHVNVHSIIVVYNRMLIDRVLSAMYFLSSIGVVFCHILIALPKFKHLVDLLSKTEKYVKYRRIEEKRVHLQLCFFISAGFGVFFAIELSASFFTGAIHIEKFIHRIVPQFYFTILFLLSVGHVLIIRVRFGVLNEKLAGINSNNLTKGMTNLHRSQTISEVQSMYYHLSRAVESWNQIFGWQILFYSTSVCCGILFGASFTIHVVTENSTEAFELYRFLGLAWSQFLLFLFVTLIVVCNNAVKEAQRTEAICYMLLADISSSTTDAWHSELGEELRILAHQTKFHSPHFSASGFYQIDHPLLLGLCGTITSYIIVLLQINS